MEKFWNYLDQFDPFKFFFVYTHMVTKTWQHNSKLIEFSKKAGILEKKKNFSLLTTGETIKIKITSKILNSYLRLAVSYARKYSSYGLSIDDLIHEGVLGIMHALDKFDTSKDFRLSTYASWWIRELLFKTIFQKLVSG